MKQDPESDWAPAPTSVPGEMSKGLWSLGGHHGFALRQPGVEVEVERALAVERLTDLHRKFQMELGLGNKRLCLAEQVHGAEVACVEQGGPEWFPGVDGLITRDLSVSLGIYVADCCAVFLLDPEKRAVGLAHSGAKGTRLGIVLRMIDEMQRTFGCKPRSMMAVLSPCIRPPHYEVDFALQIRAQCTQAGIGTLLDSNRCTGTDLRRYYSYRRESGKTGRMLALLALETEGTGSNSGGTNRC